MSINIVSVPSNPHYDKLLNCFKREYHERLKLYTAEELYYVWRIVTYKPSYNNFGDIKSGDTFLLVLKHKMIQYLTGETRHPIYPSAWGKIGRRFTKDFVSFLETTIDIEQAKDSLSKHFRRVV